MEINEILDKYSYYAKGTGFTFLIDVEDYKTLLRRMAELEGQKLFWLRNYETLETTVKELEKEIKEHCETKGLVI